MVGKVQTLVEDGSLTDAGTRDFIAGQLKAFSAFAESFKK